MRYVITVGSVSGAAEMHQFLTGPGSDLAGNASSVAARTLADLVEVHGDQLVFDDEVLDFLRAHRTEDDDGFVEDSPRGPVLYFGGTGYLAKVRVLQPRLVRLYESNSDAVYVQLVDDDGVHEVWDLTNEPADRPAGFIDDAQGWLDGDWAPGVDNAAVAGDAEGLRLVAVYHEPWGDSAGGVEYVVRPGSIGGAQRTYLGLSR